ncbi:sigma-70 family RNA polymerase sigma factor [Janibacter melonis]|uniref:RNA polymerase sigma factor n=1 Tax=Janibacter melonis TaxID=262209 RepID=UPI0020443164|nr:sigma-70 family RNA polymerase sigma factor [Janibacter melonis]MCM3556693.1 sigma-70 family RNA polymerase sigma factor [Janibacter melonis]
MEPRGLFCVYRGVKVERRGDLEQIYTAYYPRLVAEVAVVTGSRSLAEDCVGEAFARLVLHWNKVSRYQQPRAWVRRVAHNLAVDESRRRRRLGSLDEVPEPHAPEHTAELREVWGAIAALPSQQREVLVRRVVDGATEAEMAVALRVPVGTIKSRLSRARSNVRHSIGDGA